MRDGAAPFRSETLIAVDAVTRALSIARRRVGAEDHELIALASASARDDQTD